MVGTGPEFHLDCDSGVLGLAFGLMAEVVVAEPESGPDVMGPVGTPVA